MPVTFWFQKDPHAPSGKRILPVASASERPWSIGGSRYPLCSISDGNNSRGPSGLGDEVGLCTSTWCCLVIPCYFITGSQRRDAFYRSTGLEFGSALLGGTASMLVGRLAGGLLSSRIFAIWLMASVVGKGR